jgi:hypothetical protein
VRETIGAGSENPCSAKIRVEDRHHYSG